MMRATRFGALLLTITLVACGETLAPGDPPVLPDAESMTVELDFFNQSPAAIAGSPSLQAPGAYWLAAALSVTAANLAVAIHTLIPRAIWASALSQTPTFEDGRWHWRFNATHGLNTFQSHVIGYQEDGERVFEVRVTSTALQLDDFLFFTGRAPIGGTMGTWTFNEVNGGQVATVTWSHPENDEWLLTFAAHAGPGDGDELEYHVDGTMRGVTYTDFSAGTMVEIQWDAITSAGYIIAPNINGGVMACWDGNLANTTCP